MHNENSPWKPRTKRPAEAQAERPQQRERAPVAAQIPPVESASRERRDAELRIYGLNAVRAMFAKRPQALRKLYLLESRIPQLQPLLKW